MTSENITLKELESLPWLRFNRNDFRVLLECTPKYLYQIMHNMAQGRRDQEFKEKLHNEIYPNLNTMSIEELLEIYKNLFSNYFNVDLDISEFIKIGASYYIDLNLLNEATSDFYWLDSNCYVKELDLTDNVPTLYIKLSE